MQRKPLIVRETEIAIAMRKAAVRELMAGRPIPTIIADYVPNRALKREPTWSVTRKAA